MIHTVQHTFEIPAFGSPVGEAGIRWLRLPTWWPDPAPITHVIHWSQNTWDPATANADWGVCIDPGGQYAAQSTQPVNPSQVISLGCLELKGSAPRYIDYPFVPPVMYSESRGDRLLFAAEGTGVWEIAPFIGVQCVFDELPVTPPVNERLLIKGDGPNGGKLVRDHSISNHQMFVMGDAVLDHGAIKFSGTGWLFCDDRPIDFAWPGAFSLCAIVKTTVATPDPHNRHIWSGGAGPRAAAMAINASGKPIVGTEDGAILTGATSVADGEWHTIRWERGPDMVSRLFVDDVIQSVAFDGTSYSGIPRIGRYAAGSGYWVGHLADIYASRLD